jgi:Domain of unknown function (DUF4170)
MDKQLLHLVFGGELVSLKGHEFRDLSKLHYVGIYPNFREAQSAWRAAAQATVDNAHMRYFVVHLHRLLDGDEDHDHAPGKARSKPKAAAKAKAKPKSAAKPAKKR